MSSSSAATAAAAAAPVPRKAALLLQDGTSYSGISFGAEIGAATGECVFQTGMVGYPEALTDPSYKGQILILTYPLLGNYGVPSAEIDEKLVLTDAVTGVRLPANFESTKIHAAALVVGQYTAEFSHYLATSSLGAWLKREGIPGIGGIDTRALTKHIREKGALLGKIVLEGTDPSTVDFEDPNERNLVAAVASGPLTHYRPSAEHLPDGAHLQKTASGDRTLHILAVDVGLKYNQLRCFLKRGVEVTVVPWNDDYEARLADKSPSAPKYDGLFISNGPGDPTMVPETIARLRRVMQAETTPVFGICLGHQLMALAAGARTVKMKYGNRGHNIPCTDMRTTRCYITSQNHGYAVDSATLPVASEPGAKVGGFKELFVNANDGSNEGIYHPTLPFFSVQFHPEAFAGPQDTEFLFDTFIETCRRSQAAGKLTPIAFPDAEVAPLADGTPALQRSTECDAAASKLLTEPPLIMRQDKRVHVRKVLVLGSGGLSIGQAGEFDYSGSQAIKALKQEGIYTVLINPNIATIQTSKGLADKCYFLPVTPEAVRKVIEQERPDGIYVTFGGQTALNVGIKLKDEFEALGVKVLGTQIDTIIATEDRDIFAQKLAEINEKCAQSQSASNINEALQAAREIGFPLIVRAAYALGGLGSGFANNETELLELCQRAFASSPQVLVERSMKGWKEIEYEVVRDAYDNCITVCNMENFDPLGIHTGDSIVVAPSQTLSDDDYNMLRTTAVNVIRHLGVVGECNIQYALNPHSREYCIIEVNARLSRSSALASKATGYPLAFVAAKLGLGIPLNAIRNSVTKVTTACFEPSLDYVVVKVPRWDLKKFSRVSTALSSSMKSVGEVMSIGRTFEEAIQEAVRAVETSFIGFGKNDYVSPSELTNELMNPSDLRLFAVANALHQGMSVDKIHQLTCIDKWFLHRLNNLTMFEQKLETIPNTNLDYNTLLAAKQLGFSDRQIARCVGSQELAIRKLRMEMGITPYAKQIDTVAAEFPAHTNYLYMTYNATEHDVDYNDKGVIVLGSGVYRIGSSVEFDWCAVRCIRTLRSRGVKTIMINYNPETVSTDYDEADRLYFETITLERVLDIYEAERSTGIVVSMGGQAPNNIALSLYRYGASILGTSPESIDNAENRFKFSRMCDKIGVDQPQWKELTSFNDASEFCSRVGFPVLVRPSYVLSGAAMNVVHSADDLASYLNQATAVSRDHPVVITKFIEDAKEIEMDAVARDGVLIQHVISEHVENAGVHSGDATLILPPQDLDPETVRKVEDATRKIASALCITGPMNIQFIAKNNEIKVIECNVRASRSFPFVSKVLGIDMIEMATLSMLSLPTESYPLGSNPYTVTYNGMNERVVTVHGRVGVKAPQFSFGRLLGADPILGVEMASTGEVACFGKDKYEAYLKALIATSFTLPKKNVLLSVGSFKEKNEILPAVKRLHELGFNLFATAGTADFLSENGVPVHYLEALPDDDSTSPNSKLRSGASTPARSSSSTGVAPSDIEQALAAPSKPRNEYSLTEYLANNKIDLYINLPSKNRFRRPASYISRGYLTRRMAVDLSVPLITNIKCARLFIEALARWKGLTVSSIDILNIDEMAKLPGLVAIAGASPVSGSSLERVTSSALAGGFTSMVVPVASDELAVQEMQNAIRNGSAKCDIALAAAAGTKPTAGTTSPIVIVSTMAQAQQVIAASASAKAGRAPLLLTDAKGAALAAILFLATAHRQRVHVTDISGPEDLALVLLAKTSGLSATCDVPALRLLLSSSAAAQAALAAGAKFPANQLAELLLTDAGVESLWSSIDSIDCISIGSLPARLQQLFGSSAVAPAADQTLPLLMNAVKAGRLTVADLTAKLSENPRAIFGLPAAADVSSTYVEVQLGSIAPPSAAAAPSVPVYLRGLPSAGSVGRVVIQGSIMYLDGVRFSGSSLPRGSDLTDSVRIGAVPSAAAAVAPATPVVRATQGAAAAATAAGVAQSPQRSARLAVETAISPAARDVSGSLLSATTAPGFALPSAASAAAPAGGASVKDILAEGAGEPFDAAPRTRLISEIPSAHNLPLLPRNSPFYRKHITSVRQFTRDDLHILFGVAQEMRQLVERHGKIDLLKGRIMYTLFYEASSRTCGSFTAAMQRLGGSVVNVDVGQSSVRKGETIADTVRTFGCYGDIIVMRHPEPGSAQIAAKFSPIPVINGGDGVGEHPSQALLDVFTIREELGTVNGLTIVLVGDLMNGRTVHSLVYLLAQYHVTLHYVSPASLRMPESIRREIAQLGITQHEHTELTPDLVAMADVLYVTRVQQERFADPAEYERVKNSFVITNALMAKAKPTMALMHPLPRTSEINPEVDFDPRAAYFRQMRHGMFARMALLALVLGKSN
ncbi:carbamoyl-phosphate synth [Ramicandelaber brevisporus]|nr:carbamoyl-phosphate synth [Ramicandelaber brevisporus]